MVNHVFTGTLRRLHSGEILPKTIEISANDNASSFTIYLLFACQLLLVLFCFCVLCFCAFVLCTLAPSSQAYSVRHERVLRTYKQFSANKFIPTSESETWKHPLTLQCTFPCFRSMTSTTKKRSGARHNKIMLRPTTTVWQLAGALARRLDTYVPNVPLCTCVYYAWIVVL